MNSSATVPWSQQGCSSCRAVWERSESPQGLVFLGTSNVQHARLHRCRVCGAYWEELERYAHHVSDAEAYALLAQPCFERAVPGQ